MNEWILVFLVVGLIWLCFLLGRWSVNHKTPTEYLIERSQSPCGFLADTPFTDLLEHPNNRFVKYNPPPLDIPKPKPKLGSKGVDMTKEYYDYPGPVRKIETDLRKAMKKKVVPMPKTDKDGEIYIRKGGR